MEKEFYEKQHLNWYRLGIQLKIPPSKVSQISRDVIILCVVEMIGPPQFIPPWSSQTSQRDSLRLNTTACLGDTTTLKLTLNLLPLVNVCF